MGMFRVHSRAFSDRLMGVVLRAPEGYRAEGFKNTHSLGQITI